MLRLIGSPALRHGCGSVYLQHEDARRMTTERRALTPAAAEEARSVPAELSAGVRLAAEDGASCLFPRLLSLARSGSRARTRTPTATEPPRRSGNALRSACLSRTKRSEPKGAEREDVLHMHHACRSSLRPLRRDARRSSPSRVTSDLSECTLRCLVLRL
jgi:hypothetical protein